MSDQVEPSTRHKVVGAKTNTDILQHGTKRRQEQAVSIRSKSRLEMLTKKRKVEDIGAMMQEQQSVGGGAASAGGGGATGTNNNQAPNAQAERMMRVAEDEQNRETNLGQMSPEQYHAMTADMFPRINEFVAMMGRTEPPESVRKGVATIRRMLCHPEMNPVADLVRAGGIERLIDCLDHPDADIQFNAAWSLTNISSSAQSYSHLIIHHGAIPRMVALLDCPVERLREQSAWCLGNMAGDGARVRDEILNANVIAPLLNCINGQNDSIATLRNAVWLLAQLCRNKPSPRWETLEPVLPTVRRLLQHPVTEIQDDACWAVSYLSDGPPPRINAVMGYGVMPLVLDMLRSRRESVQLPAVRTFGNFSATNPEMTQIVIDEGVLDLLGPLLDTRVSRQIRKEVCWFISNACAGYDEQVVAVMEAGLFPPVIENIFALEFEVRREAVWVVANATATANVDRIRYLTEHCNVLDGLCDVLRTMDSRICNIALESIEAILLAGDNFRDANGGSNPYADRVESIGGREHISRLRDHICHTVFLRSATLMDRYFDDGWGQFGGAGGGDECDDDWGCPPDSGDVETLGNTFEQNLRVADTDDIYNIRDHQQGGNNNNNNNNNQTIQNNNQNLQNNQTAAMEQLRGQFGPAGNAQAFQQAINDNLPLNNNNNNNNNPFHQDPNNNQNGGGGGWGQ